MKNLLYVYISIFLLVLLIPLCLSNTTKDITSTLDNKVLTNFPSICENDYSAKFEQALKDRIGARNLMIKTYNVVNDKIFYELSHPLYTYGKNGYIFFNMHDNIKYNDYHKTFAEMVSKLQKYCESRGCKFYLIFDPEKASVYRRYLPDGVNYDDSWVDETMEYLDKLGVPCINSTELLTQKSFNEQIFNIQYDAGHWNDLGCFYATNALLELIHKDFDEVNPLTKDMFTISTKTEKYLPNSNFVVNEKVPVFNLNNKWEDISAQWFNEISLCENYQHFHYYINHKTNSSKLPKVLFFQGSYYNRGTQFLLNSTSEYIGIHNYQNVLNLDYYFNIFKPDVVILDVAEYVFSDAYFDSREMKNIDMNPGIDLDDTNHYMQTPIEVNIQILQGKSVDKIYIGGLSDTTKYAYLISDNQIYDIQYNEDCSTLSVAHDNITSEANNYIVTIDICGNKYYYPTTVSYLKDLTESFQLSDNATHKNDVFYFETNTKGNNFNASAIQIFDLDNNYINQIYCSYNLEKSENFYTHLYPSGYYKIRIKANSNIQDEYADAVLYFKQGATYYYSLSTDEITNKHVTISSFHFLSSIINK